MKRPMMAGALCAVVLAGVLVRAQAERDVFAGLFVRAFAERDVSVGIVGTDGALLPIARLRAGTWHPLLDTLDTTVQPPRLRPEVKALARGMWLLLPGGRGPVRNLKINRIARSTINFPFDL